MSLMCTVWKLRDQNSLSFIFGKNFVKSTVLLKKLLNNSFDEISVRVNCLFYHTVHNVPCRKIFCQINPLVNLYLVKTLLSQKKIPTIAAICDVEITETCNFSRLRRLSFLFMGNMSPYYFKTIFRLCMKCMPSFIKIGGAVSEKNGDIGQTFVVLYIGFLKKGILNLEIDGKVKVIF